MKIKYLFLQILVCLTIGSMLPSCVEPVDDPDEIVDDGDDEDDNEIVTDISFEDAVSSISEIVGELYMSSETLNDLSQYLGVIKKIEGVKKAYVSDISLFVETVHGFKMSWSYFPVPQTRSSEPFVVTMMTKDGVETKANNSLFEINPDYEDICIAFQMCDDYKYDDLLTEYVYLADDLEDMGAYVDIVYDVDLEFLSEYMTNYDVLILVTHGFYEKDSKGKYKHWIMLSEDIEDYLYDVGEDVSADVMWASVKETWRGEDEEYSYMMVSEDFLADNIGGSFDQTSLVFNSAGESLKANSALADVFRKKGAGAYVGYEDAHVAFSSEMDFFGNMLQASTVSEALSDIDDLSVAYGDDVLLLVYGNYNDMIKSYDKTIGELFMQSQTITELSKHLDYIESLFGVQKAYVSDFSLFVQPQQGPLLSWSYFPESENVNHTLVTKSGVKTSGTLSLYEISRDYDKICIAFQMSNDGKYDSLYQKYEGLAEELREIGADVDILKSNKFNVDFIRKNMVNYDVVIIVSRGFYAKDVNGDDKHWLMIGESADKYISNMNSRALSTVMRTSVKELIKSDDQMSSYMMISEDFLSEQIQGRFDDTSLMFISSGESLKGDLGMVDAFASKGLCAYVGYEESTADWSDEESFWHSMLKGNNVSESLRGTSILKNGMSSGSTVSIVVECDRTPEFIGKYTESICQQVSPLFLQSDGISELSRYENEIRAIEGVEGVSFGDNYMSVEFLGGESWTWLYPVYPAEDVPIDHQIETKAAQQIANSAVLTKNNMCFIYQISGDKAKDFSAFVEYCKYLDFALYCPFTLLNKLYRKDVASPSFTLSFLENEITDYDVIFLATHGNYEGGLHWFMTGEEVSFLKWKGIKGYVKGFTATEIRNGYQVDRNYWSVSENFVKSKIKGTFKDALIINTACHSLEGTHDLAHAFKAKGAAAYVGYDNSNCRWYIGPEILKRMMMGMSLGEAIDNLPEDYRKDVHTKQDYIDAGNPDGEPHSANLISAISGGNDMYLVKESPSPGQWVDLGLSVEWAGWNVGANSPQEYGSYYAWGEMKEKNDYSSSAYAYRSQRDDAGPDHWHYGSECWCWEYALIGDEISNTSYDVAKAQWGGGARMPTRSEIAELVEKCNFKQGYNEGVFGCYVMGPNGNSIFVPYSGCKGGILGTVNGAGESGGFWAGTHCSDKGDGREFAYCFTCFDSSVGCIADVSYTFRCQGHAVRAVRNK